MRFFLAVLAATLVLFFLGAFEVIVLLPNYIHTHFGNFMRPPGDVRLWAIVLEKLIQSIFLVVVHRSISPAKCSFAQAAKLGALIALLLEGAWVLSMWNFYPLQFIPLLLLGVCDALRLWLAYIAAGYFYSRKPMWSNE